MHGVACRQAKVYTGYVRHPAALTQASHDQESLISWLCRPTLALPRTSISHVTLHLT